MNLAYLITIIFLVSCGIKSTHLEYGTTTSTHLVSTYGQPILDESIPVENSRILTYPDNKKFQLKGDIVTNSYRDPVGDEKSILFWKHKFKNCLTENIKIKSEQSSHSMPQFEFLCPQEGKGIIYFQGSEFVSRVVEFENK